MRNPLTISALIICFVVPGTQAQEIQEIVLGGSVRAFHVAPSVKRVTTFTSNSEAETAVRKILDQVGLPKNFVVRAANVPNAAAVITSQQRLILYSNIFMNRVRKTTNTDWAAISILAHEIGHHLAGHTLSSTGSTPLVELEADRFSGFILGRMGASLDQATAAMKSFGSETPSASHPARSARLEAIAAGWTQATEQKPVIVAQSGQMSSTCRFTQGPRAGQVQSYKGMVQPIPVGSPCTDGVSSYGTAIPDDSGASGTSGGSESGQMSSTCRFNQGPRAGQVQSYKGMVQPIPVGSPCTDGASSYGTAIPD